MSGQSGSASCVDSETASVAAVLFTPLSPSSLTAVLLTLFSSASSSVCRVMSDVAALQAEVSRLQAEVKLLKSDQGPKGSGSLLVSSKKSDSQWDLAKDGQRIDTNRDGHTAMQHMDGQRQPLHATSG